MPFNTTSQSQDTLQGKFSRRKNSDRKTFEYKWIALEEDRVTEFRSTVHLNVHLGSLWDKKTAKSSNQMV